MPKRASSSLQLDDKRIVGFAQVIPCLNAQAGFLFFATRYPSVLS